MMSEFSSYNDVDVSLDCAKAPIFEPRFDNKVNKRTSEPESTAKLKGIFLSRDPLDFNYFLLQVYFRTGFA